ncbi:MAG: oxygen-independent coproporphyrinogen III oxidase [Pseudomonadota bacterium]
MTDALNSYVTRNVPRYTSYPTAPHFSGDVGHEDYARCLEKLDPADPISLYLHVPFCRELCWYCGCNMKLATREAPLASYAQTLRHEIELVARYLPAPMTFGHLHWGGGTPTALVPKDLADTMQTVHRHFKMADGAELAIESDPRTLTPEMIRTIGALGFNRASFGVQEFDPKVQAAINRIQPPDMVASCVDDLRSAGISAINFDLIYGLPHQSVNTLLETIRLCLKMEPDRIALFGYAHVPWMAKKQRLIDEAALPGAQARVEQASQAAQYLKDHGYEAIGLDHFAKPSDALAKAAKAGTMRRNFQGYTTDQADTMLGLGATSIGHTPSSYVQNTVETGAWARAVEGGQLPIARGFLLSKDDQMRGDVIEQIMCRGSVDLAQAAKRFGNAPDWYGDTLPLLAELARDGLITLDGSELRVTHLGQPLVRVIAAAFDTYLQSASARHAIAV